MSEWERWGAALMLSLAILMAGGMLAVVLTVAATGVYAAFGMAGLSTIGSFLLAAVGLATYLVRHM
jgi:hypothetical protein